MKRTMAKKIAYLGAGAGLALFTLFGLLYGPLLAGVMGLQLTGMAFGPAEFGVVARVIVALGVMFGVLLTALVCVAGSATMGYLIGLVIDVIKAIKSESSEIHNAVHHS